jgi:hypothetical protein
VTSSTLHLLARKISAISFILLILIGHFWALMIFLGQAPSAWVQPAFLIGTLGALSGGLLMLLLKIAAVISALRGHK